MGKASSRVTSSTAETARERPTEPVPCEATDTLASEGVRLPCSVHPLQGRRRPGGGAAAGGDTLGGGHAAEVGSNSAESSSLIASCTTAAAAGDDVARSLPITDRQDSEFGGEPAPLLRSVSRVQHATVGAVDVSRESELHAETLPGRTGCRALSFASWNNTDESSRAAISSNVAP